MEESGRLAALQLELDTKAAAVRQLRDELASKDEEMEFLREELHTKTEELEEVRICYFCFVSIVNLHLDVIAGLEANC